MGIQWDSFIDKTVMAGYRYQEVQSVLAAYWPPLWRNAVISSDGAGEKTEEGDLRQITHHSTRGAADSFAPATDACPDMCEASCEIAQDSSADDAVAASMHAATSSPESAEPAEQLLSDGNHPPGLYPPWFLWMLMERMPELAVGANCRQKHSPG